MNYSQFIHFIKKSISGSVVPEKIALILAIALISFGLVSCGGDKTDKPGEKKSILAKLFNREKTVEPEKLVNVRLWTAETKKVQPYLETTGTLKADEEVTVSSEVDGIIKKIHVEQGTSVNSGTLLVEINETDYHLDWKRSDAALRQAQASLANAKAEFQRKSALYKEELITKQQFDDVSTRQTLAEADLERAKATLDMSREKLVRTKIYSPLRGAVKEKKVSVGDYVRNGTPLLQLIKPDPLKLNFTVSEKDAAIIRIGQEVVFSVDAFAGKQFKGKVSLLYPNVEERTRTLQAEAIVPNPGNVLRAGYFARIQVFSEAARNAVVIPLTSILYDSAIVHIFVVEGNVAKDRLIKTGVKQGEYIEVVEGLKEKEQVVVVGQNNLSEGVKINVAR